MGALRYAVSLPYFFSFCRTYAKKRCIHTIITHRNHYVRSAEQRIRRFLDLSFNPTQTTLLHRHMPGRIKKDALWCVRGF
jgi:hypothetical protein